VIEAGFDEPVLAERYRQDDSYINIRQQLVYARPKLMTAHYLDTRRILKAAIDRSLDEGMPADVSLALAQQAVDRLPSP
jgi:hypothetical protein